MPFLLKMLLLLLLVPEATALQGAGPAKTPVNLGRCLGQLRSPAPFRPASPTSSTAGATTKPSSS